jgi:hypothetical protein
MLTDATVLRTLKSFLRPDKIRSGMVIFDTTDHDKWSARIEVSGKDRWFKGVGKMFKEEIWIPNEDPENQICLP